MKTLLKTVSLTLCISVTMLFFSSYKKVEAAAAGAAVAAGAAIATIGSLIISAAAYFSDAFPNVDVAGIISHTEFKESISVSEDGTATYAPPSVPYVSINEKAWAAFNSLANEATKEYNSSLRVYICGGSGGDPGNNGKIPSNIFNGALSATILGALAAGVVEWAGDVAGGTDPSGAAAGITMGITTVNGKPQKVTTTYAEETVEVFDYLGLEYRLFDNISDFQIEYKTGDNESIYLPFILTTDKKLYHSSNIVRFSSGKYDTIVYGSHKFYHNYSSEYYDSYLSFKFYEENGIFASALYYSTVYELGKIYRSQVVYSNPKLEDTPILFSDKLPYSSIGETSLRNISEGITFGSYLNTNLSNSEILSLDIAKIGYFVGNPESTAVKTAEEMLSETDNLLQGGTNTTYSDLSDIEKAIYALAKQQGITYEEMLKQCNIMINENGEMYLETLDGVTHSIESLLSEFEKLLEQGDITNENIAASTEQLKAILEYLKGLNIEGLGSYIQQLEATLDDLKQGDENREAILSDISVQLTELKENLDTLGFAEVAADIKNISQILSDAAAKELDVTEIESIDPDWYIEKFPFCLPFDFYRIITLFVRDPVPPVFTIPIEAELTAFGLDQSVDEEIVLDLTVFKINGVDIVQVVLNFVCILGFVLMLIHNTTKFFV